MIRRRDVVFWVWGLAIAALFVVAIYRRHHVASSSESTEANRSVSRPEASGRAFLPSNGHVANTNEPFGPRRQNRFQEELARLRREWSSGRYARSGGAEPAEIENAIHLEVATFVPTPGVEIATGQEPTPRQAFPYIVQFRYMIRDGWKDALTCMGCVLRGYIPENALLAEVPVDRVSELAAFPFVRAVTPYKPQYKIEPFLSFVLQRVEERRAASEADEEWPSADIRIQTLAPEDAPVVAERLLREGLDVLKAVQGRRWGLVLARVPLREEIFGKIARLGAVQWVEEAVPRHLHNDFAVHSRRLNVTNVWSRYGLTGRRQVIGHADTGLDSGSLTNLHPDFLGRVRVTIARGRPGDWSDTHGHGTHTAGSILGDGAASTGQFRGIAFEAQLVHQSVMDLGGGLGGLPDDLYELYAEAYTNAARIHSDSWGAAVYGEYNADSRSSDEFMWDYPDLLLVFSAGNEGRDNDANGVVDADSIGSPGTAKNVLTVGAAESDRPPGSGGYSSMAWGYAWPSYFPVDPIRNDYISQSADLVNQGLAAFSSRGPTDDGRFKPDVVAPGTDVISCRSRVGSSTGWGVHPNTNYMFSGGTSMSAPLVAGLAALIRQYYMEWHGLTNPSAALIKATLLNGARSLSPGQYGLGAKQEIPSPPRPNNAEGWGQPDLERTLFPGGLVRLSACDTNWLTTGGVQEYRLYLMAGVTSSVTLAYSDYPGTAGAGKKLVNDLDLYVFSPTGGVFYPNGRNVPDRTNNVEGIDFVPPISGIYTVRVVGFNVPYGPQPYALVFRGGWQPVFSEPIGNTTNTVLPYELRAWFTSLGAGITNRFLLLWNTNASARFQTNAVDCITGPVYRAYIPPQPQNTEIYYYFEGLLEGRVFRHPTGAPAQLLSFRVVAPVSLTVTGSPVLAGQPEPGYGSHLLPAGSVVTASVEVATDASNGFRYTCTGWLGVGSVPVRGDSNLAAFILHTNSTISWQWVGQYALTQESDPSGVISTTTWWNVGTTGATIRAPDSVVISGTNWMFTYWRVDGDRWPMETNRSQNPAMAIPMTTARTAVAVYTPENVDSDANALPDWWEWRYFGNTGVQASADSDGDGFANFTEFLDRSDPTDPTSVPMPPVLEHVPLSAVQTAPAPWRVAAAVSDSGTVISVRLGWSRNGAPRAEIPMILSGGWYTNAIPAPGTNGDVFVYDVVATDAAGLSATSGPHTVAGVYAVLVIGPGGTQQIWTIPGGQTSLTYAIHNVGNTNLFWWVQFTPSPTGTIGWWTANVTDGVLSASSATSMILSLSAAGMTNGDSRTLHMDWWSSSPVDASNRTTLILRAGLPPTISSVIATNTADTNGPYQITATITPASLVDTNALFVFWNTDGSSTSFSTATMSRITGDVYRAWIPGHPRGTRISYYIHAAGTNTLVARDPANAPLALREFRVVEPVSLVVTGTPTNVGVSIPLYGISVWPSGALVIASVPQQVMVSDGERYRCQGWSGMGSVPASGTTTQMSFFIREDSVITWTWAHELRLRQTSSIPDAVGTDTWWAAGQPAATVYAPETYLWNGMRYRFGEWQVDGIRVPVSGSAENPLSDVLMVTARTAVAIYFPEELDSDGDGLPDWWVARYGFAGGTSTPVAMYWFDRRMGRELVLDGSGAIGLGSQVWSSTQSFTITFWLRPQTNQGLQGIAGSTGSVHWALFQEDSNLHAAVYSADGGTSVWLTANGALEAGRWRHIAWVYHAPTASVLYVDGAMAAVGVASSFLFESHGALGRASLPNVGDQSWIGRIDDFAVWTVALTAEEIEAMWSRGLQPGRPLQRRLTFDRDGSGWAFDCSGENLHGRYFGSATTDITTLLWDYSGWGHHGTYQFPLWVNDPALREVFYAEGGNGAEVPHSPFLMPTGQVSIVARFRPEQVSDRHVLVAKVRTGSLVDGYGLLVQGESVTQLVGFVNDPASSPASFPISTGPWYHAVSVYSSTQVVLWMNGSIVTAANVTGAIVVHTQPLYLGGIGGTWGLVGRLREVRIYTNALSELDVKASELAWDDEDGDGWPNVYEFQAGTDPTRSEQAPSPPVIAHVPLAALQTTPAPWLVRAAVTSASHRIDVALWWRRNGTRWNTTPMTNTNGEFVAWLPAPGRDGDVFDYRIEAIDALGLCTTSGPHTFAVSYPIVSLYPTNLELLWLMPGTTTTKVFTLSNVGSASLAWNLRMESAGLTKDTVEFGAGVWTHGGTEDLWRVSTNRSYSAIRAWYCGRWDEPGYANSVNAWLMSGPIYVLRGSKLRFWHWIDTEVDEGNPPYAHDGGVVEISTNGATFTPLVPEGGYPYRAHGLYGSPFPRDMGIFAGTGGWQFASFDLGAYAGKMVWIRFRFGSDEAFAVGEGWYVDDIEVSPAPEDRQWISLSATNGLLESGVSNILVALNVSGLEQGTARGGRLAWTFSDPATPQITVPVSVFVGSPIVLDHEPLWHTTYTQDPYVVTAKVEQLGVFDSNSLALQVIWSTNAGLQVWTNNLVLTGDNVWTGIIPAQPAGAEVVYYLCACVGDFVAHHPSNAPAVWHSFKVRPPVLLTVTGSPALVGFPVPFYGSHWMPADVIVTARAPDLVSDGIWLTCTGWTGSGSVPPSGSTNGVSFLIQTASTLRWQWQTSYLLLQTSSPAGILSNSAWLTYGVTTQTVTAPLLVSVGTTVHRFVEWRLNGVRQGAAKAVNPVVGIAMTSAQFAAAIYWPETQDIDDDGLPDAWEMFYFGTLSWAGSSDPDGDGFANAVEYVEGTDPTDPLSVAVAPSIAHVPLASPQTTPPPWLVSAAVTDNVGLATIPVSGYALAFTAPTHYAMRSPMNAFPTSAITVEFWIKTSDRARRGTPISYAVPGGFDDANEFTLYNHNTFLIYRGNVYTNTRVSAADGRWHHIAVTWRSSDGRARLYKDGELAFEATLQAGTAIRPRGSLVLGQDQDSYGSGFSSDDAFVGLLDEVRIWNIERTADEIRANMSNRLSGAEVGLVSYWSFEDGGGTLARDWGPAGNDLNLVGVVWTNADAFYGPAVRLLWSRNNSSWQAAFMTRSGLTLYSALIEPPGAHGDHYEYWIEATDGAGLTATNGPHVFSVALAQISFMPTGFTNVWLAPNTITQRWLVISNSGAFALSWQITREHYGFQDDIERGTNGWISSGANNQWHISAARSRSPVNAWFFGDEQAGTYANNADAILDTPPISLGPEARLTFWHWCDLEMRSASVAWDGAIVEISTNRGLTFEQLTPIGGYPYTVNGGWGQPFPGGSGVFAGWGGWTQAVFDLSGYAGHDVIIRFHVGTDMVNDYPAQGWFIDDVMVTPSATTGQWLTLTPESGWLVAGASTSCVLTFDATGSSPGDLLATKLMLVSDDLLRPTNTIPVILRIGSQPVISHTPLGNQAVTSTAYRVSAVITPREYLNTSRLWLLWETNGTASTFTTTRLTQVTGDVYQAEIPAQPRGTRVRYYLLATSGDDITTTHPSGAPNELHEFEVADLVSLTVTGSPSLFGDVDPPYGQNFVPSGALVRAIARPTDPTGGVRWAASGWLGLGSVPTSGTGDTVVFTCREDSVLTWQWQTQYLLMQTATHRAAVFTGTWWFVGSTAQTITAPLHIRESTTNYHFAHWLLDGIRQPDPSNAAVNPVTGIVMAQPQTAVAVYVAEFVDRDGDDIPDWWEYRYFGDLYSWRTDDPDGDGFGNLAEFLDQTDPRDASSYPQPPLITHTPLADPQITPPPWVIVGVITDNAAVSSAILYWKRNAGDWESSTMTQGWTATYSALITGPAANGDRYTYFIVATDRAGLAATAGMYQFEVALPGLRVSPADLGYVFLPPNSSTSFSLMVWNEGGVQLAWTASISRVGFWDGFEGGTNAWTCGGVGSLWHISTSRAFSGTAAWYGGNGDTRLYANGMNAWLATPVIMLPTSAVLRFASFIDVELKNTEEAYDAGLVELSVTGSPFFVIHPSGGYPFRVAADSDGPFPGGAGCVAGTGTWQWLEFDLSTWAGQLAQVRFRFGSDSTKVKEGWYIDDVGIYPATGEGEWVTFLSTSGVLPPASTNFILGTVSSAAKPMGTWWPVNIEVRDALSMDVFRIPLVMVVYGNESDFDGDGMPDAWELVFGFDPARASDAVLDPDSDGYLNVEEFLAGTDPLDGASYFRILAAAWDQGMGMELHVISGRVYEIEAATSLLQPVWTNVLRWEAATNEVLYLTPTDELRSLRHYRIKLRRK